MQDPQSRVACETLVKSNCVTIAGEITTGAKFDYEQQSEKQYERLDTLMTMIFSTLTKFL